MEQPREPLDNASRRDSDLLHYDSLIVGAGQAGVPLASALAKSGQRVALVEREHVGGTCVNVGCTPTKTMIASAKVAEMAHRAQEYGVVVGEVTVDLERVRQRKRELVTTFRNGSQESLERIPSLDLIFGEARFTAPRTIEVDGERRLRITADRVFINVGSRPVKPPIAGLDRVPALDSTTIMELDEVPRHLLIIGGGYVGVEFAQMFRRFGSSVTLVQRQDQLLPREDPDMAAALEEILAEDGIEIMTGAEARAVESTGDGLALTVGSVGGERVLDGSHLLVAAGRRPNTDGLGLELAGLEVDGKGFIEVDETLSTSAKDVWALGEVNGSPAFTHISYDDYRILRDEILNGRSRTVHERQYPYTVFTDPQLGRVGMTERDARAKGHAVAVAKMPANRVARALETGNSRGLWKAVVDAETERILGAAILGEEGGEVMAVVQVAMMGGLSYKALREAVFAHPTYAESLNNLFTTLKAD